MRGAVASLNLSIPYGTDTGTVDIDLAVTNVIITGNRTDTALTNVVIGGALVQTAFETTIMQLLPQLGGDVTFDDIGPILENLYDVQVNGGVCGPLGRPHGHRRALHPRPRSESNGSLTSAGSAETPVPFLFVLRLRQPPTFATIGP
jgi:hypothetical protein